MALEKQDHVAIGLSRLPSAFRNKPRIVAFLTAFLTECNRIEDALWDLLTKRKLDGPTEELAFGYLLDRIGRILGAPRKGRDDEAYRRLLRAVRAVLRSCGRPPDLYLVARLYLGLPAVTGMGIREMGTATYRLLIDGEDVTYEAGVELARLLLRATGSGIGMELLWAEDTGGTFRYATAITGVETDNSAGYAWDGSGVGGGYAVGSIGDL